MSKQKRLPPVIAENDLLSAVNNYITAHGGSAVVLGPTVVIHMPDDAKHVYYLAVKFTGIKPDIRVPAKAQS